MVLYDDKKWLCRLIRTAFTIEDDSGVCEKVLKERPYLGGKQDPDSSSVSSEDSFDIRDGADVGHRRRSNTAIRLEKLDKQRKVQNLTQVVRPTDLPVKNDLSFEKVTDYKDKRLSKIDDAVKIDKLLESAPHPDKIPFALYAKFEASCHPSVPCKKIDIFVLFLPPRFRSYPIRVGVASTASVLELIGLVLWLVSQSHPDVKLNSVYDYNLNIADDDGEYDTDFPPLDCQELISKFSFSHLALLHSNEIDTTDSIRSKSETKYSFLLPNGTTFKIPFSQRDRATLTLKDVIALVLDQSDWRKQKLPLVDPTVYHFEKLGNAISKFKDLSMNLGDCKCKEFCLVRNGAKSFQTAIASEAAASSQTTNSIPGGRSELYPVTVTGRFNRVRNALCVIRGRERMDLEFQTKTKSYPFSQISGVKLDSSKNRVIVSISQISAMTVGSHYLTNTSHLHLSTTELRTASELYHHLSTIIDNKPKTVNSVG